MKFYLFRLAGYSVMSLFLACGNGSGSVTTSDAPSIVGSAGGGSAGSGGGVEDASVGTGGYAVSAGGATGSGDADATSSGGTKSTGGSTTSGTRAIVEFVIPTTSTGPSAITAGPDGAMWFTQVNGSVNRIGRISTAGVITEFSIPTALAHPSS